MIEIAPTVKDDPLDSLFQGPLRDETPDELRLISLVQTFKLIPNLGIHCGRCHNGTASTVINYLSIDLLQAPEHIEARTVTGACHMFPNTLMPPSTRYVSINLTHLLTPLDQRTWILTPKPGAAHQAHRKSLDLASFSSLATNMLTLIPDTLALIWLRFANGADLGCNLSDQFLVDPFDGENAIALLD